jgi:mono/diheme cytochrome c family protein
MNKLTISVVFLSFVIFGLACKRSQDPIGGVSKAPASAPQYDNGMPNVAASSGLALVSAVAPSSGEKEALSPDALYAQVCGACHQMNGQGIPGAFPPLDNSKYVTSDNVDRLASIMLYGLIGPIKVNGVQYNSAMAGLGGTQSDEELAAIATYIRSAWSNKAVEVEPSVFSAMREKWGSRGPFNIQELGEEAE